MLWLKNAANRALTRMLLRFAGAWPGAERPPVFCGSCASAHLSAHWRASRSGRRVYPSPTYSCAASLTLLPFFFSGGWDWVSGGGFLGGWSPPGAACHRAVYALRQDATTASLPFALPSHRTRACRAIPLLPAFLPRPFCLPPCRACAMRRRFAQHLHAWRWRCLLPTAPLLHAVLVPTPPPLLSLWRRTCVKSRTFFNAAFCLYLLPTPFLQGGALYTRTCAPSSTCAYAFLRQWDNPLRSTICGNNDTAACATTTCVALAAAACEPAEGQNVKTDGGILLH